LCCKDISEKWAKFGYLIVSGGILNVLEPVISSFPVLRAELHVSAETVEKGLDRDQFVLILLHYDSLAFL
jgi:hypothetical protein